MTVSYTHLDAVIEIEPKSITVTGPETDMEGLEEISLGSVDLSKVVGTKEYTFPITLDPGLENVSGITSAKVTVKVEGLSTATFEVGNITVNQPPDGYLSLIHIPEAGLYRCEHRQSESGEDPGAQRRGQHL